MNGRPWYFIIFLSVKILGENVFCKIYVCYCFHIKHIKRFLRGYDQRVTHMDIVISHHCQMSYDDDNDGDDGDLGED